MSASPPADPSPLRDTSPLRDWGRVLRLSLAPSAPADVAAGIVLGAAGAWPGGGAPWLLLLSSSLVYHGGMALNDWADREEDARVRPDRPLPAGRLRPGAVLAAAGLMLAAGPLLALAASPRAAAVLAAVAAAAALYDLAGRGPWRGPLLLGACRAGNLGAGLVLGLGAVRGAWDARAWAVCGLYGLYVLSVSRLGRLEDRSPTEDLGRAPSAWILGAAVALALLPLIWIAGVLALEGAPVLERRAPYLAAAAVLGLWGAWPLARRAARRSWKPPDVLPAMGLALRRLLVFSATCALLAGAPAAVWVAGAILLGYPASYALRRVFPPS